ncbi:uncharacterized protein [Embiotoca jacksoni]|uniref:uncharacterized protein n=1 Tax=Embiotoca jacksoni TaxID=100190 RepID=UPI003704B36A
MTSLKFVFCLMCLFFGEIAQMTELKVSPLLHQERSFVSADVGDEVTLKCFDEGQDTKLYWYKQPLGQRPRVVSTFYKYDKNGTFYNEFKNNTRFTLHTENSQNHLMIKDLRISDSATYYCASNFLYILNFAEGVIVNVGGSGLNIKASVHQSESIQPGGSVTLNCTVHTGTCDGEHRVYWFKDSEESHPGLIYTDGGSNDQCERKPNTQTHTCVYNLPMKSLNPSHAGIYYCAVASCGHILFGNSTKLEFGDDVNPRFLVYFWSAASAFATVLSVVLASLLCMLSKRDSCSCRDSKAKLSASSKANAKGFRDRDNLNRSRGRRDDTWSECVYFSVKQ